MSPKVYLIGLDGASPDFIFTNLRDLSTFKKIVIDGVSGVLESSIPPVTCPAWNCLITGKSPESLQLYDWEDFRFDTGPFLSDWSMKNSLTLFEFLSKFDKKVISLNLPLTYPPRKIKNCIIISGFPLPENRNDFFYPPTIKKELGEIIRDHKELNPEAVKLRYTGDYDEFINEINLSIEKTLELAEYFAMYHSHDLFIVVFTALDRIQHYFWHFIDEKHPKYNYKNKKYVNIIKKTYMKIDRALNTFLKHIDEDSYIFIVSDHGFGPLYGHFLINNWFIKEKLLVLNLNLIKRIRNSLINLALSENIIYQRLFPKKILKYRFIKKLFATLVGSSVGPSFGLSSLYNSLNLSKTKAIGLSNGKIYINSDNILEKKKIVDDIINGMSDLKDPISGKTLNIKFYRREHSKYGPDLLVIIEDYKYNTSPKIGGNTIWEIPATQSGGHRVDGVILFKGPDVKKHIKIKAKIYDIAPTILHIFGLPIPRDMDGKILANLFNSNSKIIKRKPIYVDVSYYCKYEKEKLKIKIRYLKQKGKI